MVSKRVEYEAGSLEVVCRFESHQDTGTFRMSLRENTEWKRKAKQTSEEQYQHKEQEEMKSIR